MHNLIKNIKPLSKKYNNIFVERKKQKIVKTKIEAGATLNFKETSPRPQAILNRRDKKNFTPLSVIDLHTRTRDEAFSDLLIFFSSAIRDSVKRVMVITGGNNVRKTVLREAFLEWIKGPFACYVSAFSEANIKDGGQGAFYITLRSDESQDGILTRLKRRVRRKK